MKSLTIGFAVIFCAAIAILAGCAGESAHTFTPDSSSLSGPFGQSSNAVVYKTLYDFKGGSDGSSPETELTELDGKLYGTTFWGGHMSCWFGYGCGTLFEVSVGGTHRVLHSFTSTPHDGAFPSGPLLDVSGNLYGLTSEGGTKPSSGSGTVYELTASGQEKVLYSFAMDRDGRGPVGSLVEHNGVLFGATTTGGDSGCYSGNTCGTVFKTTLSGKETLLYGFRPSIPPKDGVWPHAGLTVLGGNLYGTTPYGGTTTNGTVYEISPAGKERVLYSFQGGHDGAEPYGPLTVFDGNLVGTTIAGGAYGYGTVYEISPSGKERVLYAFKGSPHDGASPAGRLIAMNGQLYGTTGNGGTYKCLSNGTGCGTVFVLSASGKETALHNFAGGKDGAFPGAGLTTVNGTLYGTTTVGGGGKCGPTTDNPGGCGTIFSLTP